MRRKRDGGDQLTGRERTAAFVVGEQNRCHRDGFGDRAGHTPVPESFGGDHEVDGMRLDAVEPFGYQQRRHAEVGQRRPDLAAGTGVARRPCAHRRGNVGCAERGVDARGEVALLFVDLEVHFCPLGSRGRPSSRSAMMLR